jgi:hypothetical protein
MPKAIYINESAYVEGMIVTGVTSLSTAISSEISTRGSVNTSLSTAISTETSSRTTYDSSLSTSISNVYNNLNLSGLTDVAITSPTSNDIIIYSGSSWVNYSPIDGDTIYFSISGGTLYGKSIYNSAYTFSSDNELISKKYVDDLITASGITDITNYANNRVLTSTGTAKGVYSESDLIFDGTYLSITGSTSLTNYYYLGTPYADNTWRWFINGDTDLEFQKCVSGGTYIYKSKIT